MAENSGLVRCSCRDCAGVNLVCPKTRKRHQSKEHGHAKKRPSTEPTSATLHPGTSMTAYMLCMQLLNLYNKFSGVTQNCVTEILGILRNVLGSLLQEELPNDFYELERLLQPYLLNEEIWATCPGECDIYRGSSHGCQKELCQDGKGKAYHYLPIIPRLRQMYNTPEIAKMLQEHVNDHPPHNEIRDVQDSSEWRKLYGEGGQFQGDPRAIALQFSADGFSPFHHSTSAPYSVEQQASIVLNLPPDIRTQTGFVVLHGLIPGPSAPKGEKYNLYLRPIVEELKVLEKGVSAFDSFRNEEFTLRAMIFMHVHDFPGQAKVFQGHGSGAKCACPMCRTEGVYSNHLHKTIYRGGRQFLAADDPLRKDTSFPGGKTEEGMPTKRNFERETIATALHGTLTDRAKNAPARSSEKRLAKKGADIALAMGARKRSSEFDRLGPAEASKIAVEGMHTIQGVAKNLHGLLNGHNDSAKVREHEQQLGRFPGCYPDDRGRLPQAPFTLSEQEKKCADNRLCKIQVPPGKGVVPKSAFGVFHTVKSHTWHLMLTKGIYVFALRELLGAPQRLALFRFCHILSMCAGRVLFSDLMDRIEKNFHRCICIMDREFPETLKTILWHMLRHFPEFLKKYGPLHSYWMFYFERQIHTHVSRMHNKKHPEASMVASHKIEALCTFIKYQEMTLKEQNQHPRHRKPGAQWRLEKGKGWTWRGDDKWDNSSIIYTRANGKLNFGSIMFFFDFLGETRASVRWFAPPRQDPDTMLLIVDPESRDTTVSPVIKLAQLPEPLVIAVENGVVFILDFMDRVRCEQLLNWVELS